MRKYTAFLLAVIMLLTGCTARNTGMSVPEEMTAGTVTDEAVTEVTAAVEEESDYTVENISAYADDDEPDFETLDDPELLQYIEDSIYAGLEENFASDDYAVQDIHSIYISKEYLDELEYNSQSNIFFGYTLKELDERFSGTRYVFTVGDDGHTAVEEFEGYDDSYERAIRDAAIGTGVILVCVTVSILTAGTGTPSAVSVIFATSAKTAATAGLQAGALSGAMAAMTKGLETDDMDEVLKSAAVEGSKSFKWAAIAGAVTGGLSEYNSLNKNIRTPRESEKEVLKRYGGDEQVSYLNGEKVPYGTKGSSRPDGLIKKNGHLEAIEVKNYDLEHNSNELCSVLKKQITKRWTDLPEGSEQRVILDVRGRDYSKEFMSSVVKKVQASIGSDVPIDILWI